MNPMWSEDYTEPMIRGDEAGGRVNPKFELEWFNCTRKGYRGQGTENNPKREVYYNISTEGSLFVSHFSIGHLHILFHQIILPQG